MDDSATVEDVVNCYRLALGREPESQAVIAEKLGRPRAGLLPDFFSSAEFTQGVRPAAASGKLRLPLFRQPPDAALRAWTTRAAPLSAEGRQAVGEAGSWYGLYHALFTDPAFTAVTLDAQGRSENPGFVDALAYNAQVQAANALEACVELVSAHEVRGWAIDRAAPDRRLALELRIGERLVCATVAAAYRPDIQARFGGDGRAGFTLVRPPADRALAPCGAELREAASGAVLAVVELPASAPPRVDAVVEMRRELAELRQALARLESRLPDVHAAFSYDRGAYGAYYEDFYAPVRAALCAGAPRMDLVAVVDARGAGPAALERCLASLAAQTRPPGAVRVICPEGPHRLQLEAAAAAGGGRRLAVTTAVARAGEGWRAFQAVTEDPGPAHLVFAPAQAELAADACELLAGALERGARLAYADEDRMERDADGREGPHLAPVLRPGADRELLLQQPDGFGRLLAAPRALVDALGWRTGVEGAELYDLQLRALAGGGVTGVRHLDRVLLHASAPAAAPAGGALRAVQDHLASSEPTSRAEAHRDALGAQVQGAFRVRRRPPADVRAAVVIPTRDRLELLEPCLASLQASRAHNATCFEVIVVDNGGVDPALTPLVARYAAQGPVRVLRHDGAFNWSLINNEAARRTEAEVLVFLNNDTAVLTRDWCDELCAQAMREDVGAVGGRLLYEDGTIQHGGVVLGGLHAFAAHEGVGAPGADTGYLGRHALLHEAATVTGACLATRAQVFRELGGFDAVHLPVEANDTDYCLRARARGLRVLYDPYCTFYHYESRSRGYHRSPEAVGAAEAAGQVLRARWGEAYAQDPCYNAHFDRVAAPFARLRPPPSLAAATP